MIVLKLVRIYKNLKMLHEIFQLLTNLNNTYKTKYVKQLHVTDLTQINKDYLQLFTKKKILSIVTC